MALSNWRSKRHINAIVSIAFFAYLLISPLQQAAAGNSDTLLNNWVQIPVKHDPLMDNLNIPADAHVKGMWSQSYDWPLNSIHSVLLADGRVLTYGTKLGQPAQQEGRSYNIWNPTLGFSPNAHIVSTAPDTVDSFCSTAGWLADGRLLVAGGNGNNLDGKSNGILDITNNTTIQSPSSLTAERWYGTMVALADGRMVMLGGAEPYGKPRQSTPEIYENGSWRSLFGATNTEIFGATNIGESLEANPWYYPRTWLAPNGKLFGIASTYLFELDADANNSNGSTTILGTFKTPQDYTEVTAPNVGLDSTAVMFEPGKILQVGGNGVIDNNPYIASLEASIFDINGTDASGKTLPVVTETAPMQNRRHWPNATVIPDGKVVVTGGTTTSWEAVNAVHPAEIWDPATGTWTTGASDAETRSYHSSAILLPNGTVFSSGGGAPGIINNLNAEIFYPPNLFKNDSGQTSLAARPQLIAISHLDAALDDSLGVQLADASKVIAKVALVQTSATTHSFNNTQRYIPLSFEQDNDILLADIPDDINIVPPGYYMLFAIDDVGVPSNSVMVSVGGLPAPPLAYVPLELPQAAALCAAQGSECTIPANKTATIYYGVDGDYVSLAGLTGSVSCDDDTFTNSTNDNDNKNCYSVLQDIGLVLPSINAPIKAIDEIVTYTPDVNNPGATYSWNFGDGSQPTPFSNSANITHTFNTAGAFNVYLTAKAADGSEINQNFIQAIATPHTTNKPKHDSQIITELTNSNAERIWVVNPDNHTVSVINASTRSLVKEIPVGKSPRSVTIAPNGDVWVVNKSAATISVIDPVLLTVSKTIDLPHASQPHGLIFEPDGNAAYVALEATGELLKLNPTTGATITNINLGLHIRHLSISADNAHLLVSRFITPPLNGESTANIDTTNQGGEVVAVNPSTMAVIKTIKLQHSDKVDTQGQGSGIPNYLAAPVISPDGNSAWIPSKQDNIKRGLARNGQALNFQNTVRAISSKIDISALQEQQTSRIDHDNASVASAAVFHPSGVYLFVALETSRQVAVIDAISGNELFRINNLGFAPQGLTLSNNGNILHVHEFLSRSVTSIDLSPLTTNGELTTQTLGITIAVTNEQLAANVLLGKQLFYDAKDPRLARDSYMSCASCHKDGGHDGRVWDLTGFGEGLRNTKALKGRAAMGHGFLHWSGNFDELQDFERQIRELAGGLGLMSNTDYNEGSRSEPLGDTKAGLSADLDNLAAYVASLDTFASSPNRDQNNALTANAILGKAVFTENCLICHGGNQFTISAAANLQAIGTLNSLSGQRLGQALTGIDVPTLRDTWSTAPYLHNGSAATISDAILAHSEITLTETDLANVVAFVAQIGGDEAGIVISTPNQPPVANITTPANNATFTTADTIQVTVEASDTDGTISKVDFYEDDVLLATDTTTPYTYNWANLSVGTHVITAQATDNSEAFTSSNSVTVIVEAEQAPPAPNPPFNAINCANEGDICTIPANKKATVWFGVNAFFGIVNEWNVKTNVNGSIPCNIATFGDPSPGRGKSCRYIITGDIAVANKPPTVNMANPTSNITIVQGDGYLISATANDSDGNISKVEILNAGNVLATVTNPPYTIAGTTDGVPIGRYIISAKAYDDDGATAVSETVDISIIESAENPQGPSVSITVPNSNFSVIKQGDPYEITAVASDSNGTISKVEILSGEGVLATLTQAPYTLAGSTNGVPVGIYNISARAYDNDGNTYRTEMVQIEITP